jgi:hypothetical protein
MRLGLTALNNSLMMLRGLFTGAKLLKKVVIGNGFWKINAIRPEIKARRGGTRKFNLDQKAN